MFSQSAIIFEGGKNHTFNMVTKSSQKLIDSRVNLGNYFYASLNGENKNNLFRMDS